MAKKIAAICGVLGLMLLALVAGYLIKPTTSPRVTSPKVNNNSKSVLQGPIDPPSAQVREIIRFIADPTKADAFSSYEKSKDSDGDDVFRVSFSHKGERYIVHYTAGGPRLHYLILPQSRSEDTEEDPALECFSVDKDGRVKFATMRICTGNDLEQGLEHDKRFYEQVDETWGYGLENREYWQGQLLQAVAATLEYTHDPKPRAAAKK